MTNELINRLKAWVTSIIGVILMLLTVYMVIADKPLINTVVIFLLGVLMFLSKDTLVKKAMEVINRLVK